MISFYFYGVQILAILLFSVWAILYTWQLLNFCKMFVCDEKIEDGYKNKPASWLIPPAIKILELFKFDTDMNMGPFFEMVFPGFFGSMIFIFIVSFLWPLLIVSLIFYSILLLLRLVIRTDKNVKILKKDSHNHECDKGKRE